MGIVSVKIAVHQPRRGSAIEFMALLGSWPGLGARSVC